MMRSRTHGRGPLRVGIVAFTIWLLVLLSTLALALQQAGDSLTYPRLHSRKGDRCLVCGKRIDEAGMAILYRGRRVPLANEKMLAMFKEEPMAYFPKLQARGALFDEEAIPSTGIRLGWLFLGMWVFSSLITAGFSACLALGKGSSASRWFFIGFAGNVIGLLLAATRSAANGVELPPGLARVPDTAAPIPCPKCGGENHPSAGTCADCGATLKPQIEAETSRVGRA